MKNKNKLLLLLTFLTSNLLCTPRILPKTKHKKKSKKKIRNPVFTAGIEMECTIPSGPYPGGDQILLQTDRWEIHPDTKKKSCDCVRSRCINMEFATIGGLTQKEFRESVIDAGNFFYGFFVYGFEQSFVKGRDFRFKGVRGKGEEGMGLRRDYQREAFKGTEGKEIFRGSLSSYSGSGYVGSKGLSDLGSSEIGSIDHVSLSRNLLESQSKLMPFLEGEKEVKEELIIEEDMMDTTVELIREKKSLFYANGGEFIKVLKSFQVQDTPHMNPGEKGTFVCIPQVTVSLYRFMAYPILLKYVEIFVDSLSNFFTKAFNGKLNSTIYESNKSLVFLSHFRVKYENFSIFEKGDDMSKSLAFLIIYYFIGLFRIETADMGREQRKLELKYHLTIMSRLSFSDMFDNLQKTSKNQICMFILKFCSNFEKDDFQNFRTSKTECENVTPENIPKCDKYKLFNYQNEESGFIHPTEEEDRLSFSKWLLSIINEDYREKVYKLRSEKVDPNLPKTDLLSPPSGLRIMSRNEKIENNLYRYGMGKYILKNKSQYLVELRGIGRIPNMENKENYRTKMNQVYNFLYNSNSFDLGTEEDIWKNEVEGREIDNIEVYEMDRII